MPLRDRAEAPDQTKKMPLSLKLKLFGGVAAASLVAVLASGCGVGGPEKPVQPKVLDGGKKYEPSTEAALRSVIRPAMVDSARSIVTFSREHPELTFKSVGKQSIELFVQGNDSYTLGNKDHHSGAGLLLVTRRQSESTISDPSAVIYEDVYYSAGVKNDPNRAFSTGLDLRVPDVSGILAKGNIVATGPHELGWEASRSLMSGPKDRSEENDYFYDTGDPQDFPGYGTPVSIAHAIVRNVPNDLAFAEHQLDLMQPIN